MPYFFGCDQRFGRSQLALLHLGQTRGFSGSRGSHSWPQRHRQPSNMTIPIPLAFAFFMETPFEKSSTNLYLRY